MPTSSAKFLVPPVDAVALETRAADLATRSIKKGAKERGLKLAVAMMDLTTLEGMDSPGKVRHLCSKAVSRTFRGRRRRRSPLPPRDCACAVS